MSDGPADTTERSRREFLKAAGGATLGSFILSACGPGPSDGLGNAQVSSLPTGYNFHPIEPGAIGNLPNDIELSPLLMLNNRGSLLLYGSFGERYGLFESQLGLGGGPPTVSAAKPRLITGTALEDGRRIDSIDTVDLNDDGSIAVVVDTDGEISTDRLAFMAPSVYLSREGTAFEYKAGLGDEAPDEAGTLGGVFGDLSLHNDDNLLIAAMYSDREAGSPAPADTVFSGLFHLPSANFASGRELVSSANVLRGTDNSVSQFGLVDLGADGSFVSQVFSDNRDQALQSILGSTDDPSERSFVIGGSTSAGKGAVDIVRATAAKSQAPADVYFGPRVASNGQRAHVEHYSDDDAVLYLGNSIVAQTGNQSPNGNVIRGLSAPVAGPDGLLFYLLTLDSGFELCVTNGTDRATILASGDEIGGKKIRIATHGYHSDQADDEARIAFYAEFEDGSHAIVVGIPG